MKTIMERRYMKKLALVVVALCAFGSVHAMAADTDHCVSLDSIWGNNCGSSNSLQIVPKNNCGQKVYVKICIEKTNGGWSCGSDSSLRSGRKNTGFWACKATGNYKYATCTGGYKECGFKNPK